MSTSTSTKLLVLFTSCPDPGRKDRDSDKIPKPYNCGTCTDAFGDKLSLGYHQLTHAPQNTECPVCSKRFSTPWNLGQHMLAHSESIDSKCHLCPLAFVRSFSLESHLVSEHNFTQIEAAEFAYQIRFRVARNASQAQVKVFQRKYE